MRRIGTRGYKAATIGLKFATGFGAFSLAYQVNEQLKFQKQMTEMVPSGEANQSKPVNAEDKSWLVIGRQSPGYVRHGARDKHSKDHHFESYMDSPLLLKGLGTSIDNEKHYDLFVGSDFVAQPCDGNDQATPIVIRPEQMLGLDLRSIADDQCYELHFARKQGFADITQKSPFYHSSLALRETSSPSSKDTVVVTGREVKNVIAETNSTICHAQDCNLYQSNCYSASLFALTQMAKEVDKRPDSTRKTQDVRSISKMIASAVQDNFSRGVANNLVVKRQLRDLQVIQARHGLLETPTMQTNVEPPSPRYI